MPNPEDLTEQYEAMVAADPQRQKNRQAWRDLFSGKAKEPPRPERQIRLVTPEQYAAGYIVKKDGIIYHREWARAQREPTADGNYIVYEPY